MKFEIGDKVRVTNDEELLRKDGLEISDLNGCFEGVIVRDYNNGEYDVKSENWVFIWVISEDCLTPFEDDDAKEEVSRPSLDYKTEYHRVLEELLESKLLNKVLLEYIDLKL